MLIAEEYEQLNAELFEMQRQMEVCFVRLRHLAIKSADEARRLRAEARKQTTNYYTEREAAARMKISEDTLGRLRARQLVPYRRLGAKIVSYTDEDLAQIAERFAQGMRKQRH